MKYGYHLKLLISRIYRCAAIYNVGHAPFFSNKINHNIKAFTLIQKKLRCSAVTKYRQLSEYIGDILSPILEIHSFIIEPFITNGRVYAPIYVERNLKGNYTQSC